MPLSRYAEGGLLNPLFQNAGGFGLLSNEPETYIALMTAVPNKDGTGGTEANYGGYARVNATGEWAGVQAGEAMDLTGDVEFPRATSGNNVVTHMAIYDANTSGNLLAFESVGSPITITVGMRPVFRVGDLSIDIADCP
jgi:hypothetical protein